MHRKASNLLRTRGKPWQLPVAIPIPTRSSWSARGRSLAHHRQSPVDRTPNPTAQVASVCQATQSRSWASSSVRRPPRQCLVGVTGKEPSLGCDPSCRAHTSAACAGASTRCVSCASRCSPASSPWASATVKLLLLLIRDSSRRSRSLATRLDTGPTAAVEILPTCTGTPLAHQLPLALASSPPILSPDSFRLFLPPTVARASR